MKLNHKDCKHCDSYLKKLISKVTQLELCHRNRRNACVRKSINKQLHKRNLKCGILHHGCNPTHTDTGAHVQGGRCRRPPCEGRRARPSLGGSLLAFSGNDGVQTSRRSGQARLCAVWGLFRLYYIMCNVIALWVLLSKN